MIKAFHRPDTLDEALALKKQFAADAVWMAGGAKLNAKPSISSAEIAISLSQLALDQIQSTETALEIGATASLQSLIDHPQIPAALSDALGQMFSRNLRNQATLGGEIALADQHSVVLPALLALNAELVLAQGDSISLKKYIAEKSDQLILQVRFPLNIKACFSHKISNTCSAKPMVCVAVALTNDDQLKIGLSGVGPLLDLTLAASTEIEAIVLAVKEAIAPESDFIGGADAKSYLAGVLVSRLIEQVLSEEAK